MNFQLLTFACVTAGVLGLASSTAPVPSAGAANGPSSHCVTNLSKSDTPTSCYDTFTAAIAAATDGQITDAPADSRGAMNDQALLARLNASDDKKSAAATPQGGNVLIATFFADGSFSGPTLSYVGASCTIALNDIDGAVPYVSDDWNFDAFQAFNNCRVRLWQHRDFQGIMLDWARSRSDFGKLTDDVSSLQFS